MGRIRASGGGTLSLTLAQLSHSYHSEYLLYISHWQWRSIVTLRSVGDGWGPVQLLAGGRLSPCCLCLMFLSLSCVFLNTLLCLSLCLPCFSFGPTSFLLLVTPSCLIFVLCCVRTYELTSHNYDVRCIQVTLVRTRWRFKGAVCRIDIDGWTRYCSPNSKYWRRFFSPGPSSSDLTHRQVDRLTTPTGTSAHEWNEIRGVFCQLATRGAEIQLGKLAVGGFHKP